METGSISDTGPESMKGIDICSGFIDSL